jgi:hypothetical protein
MELQEFQDFIQAVVLVPRRTQLINKRTRLIAQNKRGALTDIPKFSLKYSCV